MNNSHALRLVNKDSSIDTAMVDEIAPKRIVLVVDEYPAVLAWAARAFQRSGWSVLTASDGREAQS